MKLKITPRFSTKEIMDDTIRKHWTNFQYRAIVMGGKLAHYMKHYITANRKRAGGTGNLSKAIKFEKTVGAGVFSWGIGDINLLNNQAKYWYVVNYGKKISGGEFIPGGRKYRPIEFTDGRADSSKRSQGTARAISFKRITGNESIPSVIRPMNYIQATRHQLDKEIRQLLAKLKMEVF